MNELQKQSVSLYFNLTNACNSACIFCVSSSQNVQVRHDISIENIIKAYERYDIGPGDEVILNGGEPTVYPGLLEAIERASERQALVYLCTNGRLLQRYDYAKKVLEAGVFRLSIPLHGRQDETHDRLTCRDGSLRQTIKGIQNACRVRDITGFPQELELKLLSVRSSIAEWPEIVDFIAEEFGKPDKLVLSGLNMWSNATDTYPEVTPSLQEMKEYINQALDRAHSNNMPVVLWSIPLCALNQTHQEQFTSSICYSSSGVSSEVRAIYFDPDCPQGVEVPNNEYQSSAVPVSEPCQKCNLLNACGPGSIFMQQILHASTKWEH